MKKDGEGRESAESVSPCRKGKFGKRGGSMRAGGASSPLAPFFTGERVGG